jgi:hypothetical protein
MFEALAQADPCDGQALDSMTAKARRSAAGEKPLFHLPENHLNEGRHQVVLSVAGRAGRIGSAYLGAIRRAPSMRIVSPLM